MEFTKLTKNEFEKYSRKHLNTSFLQSTKQDSVQELRGWEIEYVGLKEKGKIIAATKLMSRNTKMNKRYYYSPKGPLIDYENNKHLKYFVNKLKKHVKDKNGYTLVIEPNILYKQRDIDGIL